jgi:hypothetical protein
LNDYSHCSFFDVNSRDLLTIIINFYGSCFFTLIPENDRKFP